MRDFIFATVKALGKFDYAKLLRNASLHVWDGAAAFASTAGKKLIRR